MTTCPVISKWNIPEWYKENEELFAPPVCNKLMHKDQLTVMFVGGPNTRTDFHIEHGSEFFFQMRGNIELPTIQRGKRKVVKIVDFGTGVGISTNYRGVLHNSGLLKTS